MYTYSYTHGMFIVSPYVRAFHVGGFVGMFVFPPTCKNRRALWVC